MNIAVEKGRRKVSKDNNEIFETNIHTYKLIRTYKELYEHNKD